MKQQSTERAFDYSKPLPATSFELIEESDNGKSKILKFKCLTSFFIQEYKYGNGWGFKFITEFKNETALKNPLSVTGKQVIYSSTLDSDCTPFGRFLEFSLSRINIKDMAKQSAPTSTEPGQANFVQWFMDKPVEERIALSDKYFPKDADVDLEDEQIEQIYKKETTPTPTKPEQESEALDKMEEEGAGYIHYEDRFKHLEKEAIGEHTEETTLSVTVPMRGDRDATYDAIIEAYNAYPSLVRENKRLKELEQSFYMAICRAYNAGKQNQINIVLAKGSPDEDKMFLSSHDYFKTEHPEFTTNVP
jgi:hypothetical protein